VPAGVASEFAVRPEHVVDRGPVRVDPRSGTGRVDEPKQGFLSNPFGISQGEVWRGLSESQRQQERTTTTSTTTPVRRHETFSWRRVRPLNRSGVQPS